MAKLGEPKVAPGFVSGDEFAKHVEPLADALRTLVLDPRADRAQRDTNVLDLKGAACFNWLENPLKLGLSWRPNGMRPRSAASEFDRHRPAAPSITLAPVPSGSTVRLVRRDPLRHVQWTLEWIARTPSKQCVARRTATVTATR